MSNTNDNRIARVTGTNSCSSVSKLSLVNHGYCHDDYLRYFAGISNPARRAPIINRGYYVRFKAIQFGFQTVLSGDKKSVVISLGCGFDTSAFRYRDPFFIEIDHPVVCQEKARIIIQNDSLISRLSSGNDQYEQSDQSCFHLVTDRYILVGADLRNTEKIGEIFHHPTILNRVTEFAAGNEMNLVLFNECSLCYIEQSFADNLLRKLMEIFHQTFAPKNITYLGYEMFQSYNGGGKGFASFMLQHFHSLGAPILSFLDKNQIQNRFLDKLGFGNVNVLDMKQFYHEIIDPDERQRIKQIEPFDEWEELDQVCASYALTIATTSEPINNPFDDNPEQTFEQRLIAPIILHTTIPVFGHSTCLVDPDRIMVFGGFGTESNDGGGHGRLKHLIQFNLTDQTVSRIKSSDPTAAINRIHCRVVPLGEQRFFLSGGRTSPSAQPRPDCIIQIDQDNRRFRTTELNQPPRTAFRHLCCQYGQEKLIEFGGINHHHHLPPSTTVQVFDHGECRWQSQTVSGLDTGRHSMAYTALGHHSILMHGGLSVADDNYPEEWDRLYLLDHRDFSIQKYPEIFHQRKLYSHRMRQINDYQILVAAGGISHVSEINDTIYQIDIRTMKVVNETVLISNTANIMLFNFDFEISNTTNQLWTIGGGGNCFSFGTHFNPVIQMELTG